MDGGDIIKVELSANFFICPICLRPYQTPIFQCNSGHSLCSSFHKKSGKRCRTCEKTTVYVHNKALESIVTEAKLHCVNHEYGCRKITSCYDKAKHESECLYWPFFCPEQGCTFRGSSDMLCEHLYLSHGHTFEQELVYDQVCDAYVYDHIKLDFVTEDGTLFLLRSTRGSRGYVLSVGCVQSRATKEQKFLCELKVNSTNKGTPKCELVLRCPVPSIALEDDMKHSKYFLLVPDEFVHKINCYIDVEMCIKIEAEQGSSSGSYVTDLKK